MAKAVFFDLDGTLADTKADLCATVNHTRRDLGLAERPEEEINSYRPWRAPSARQCHP
jgi:phosphoglycolate phosphatase-like HAD superfamily hydrolase